MKFLKKIAAMYIIFGFGFLCFFLSLPEAEAGHSSSLAKRLKKGIYDEDLSCHRIIFCKADQKIVKTFPLPLVLPCDRTHDLEQSLSARKAAYEAIHVVMGYTIQLYMGDSRKTALRAKSLVHHLVPYSVELHYRQPYYTVWVGFFTARLEAYFAYLAFAGRWPTAIIRPFTLSDQKFLTSLV